MGKAVSPLLAVVLVLGLLGAGCASSAPPSPTKAPEPTKAAAPAPTSAPAATKAGEPTKGAAPTSAPAATKAPEPTKPAAEAWPVKGRAIQWIIPYAAGGSPDLFARFTAPYVEKILGTPVEIVNKPGGGGQLGLSAIAAAKPDGYTFGFVNFPSTPPSYLDPQRGADYKRSSFQAIVNLDYEPYAMFVLPSSPYKTVKDLIDAAKANPGKISVADPGLLTGQHFTTVQLSQVTGTQLSQVHFDSGATIVAEVLGGHVTAGETGASPITEHFKNGTLRLIAVMDEKETKIFPGVKSLKEQGYNVVWQSRYGLAAPAGIPRTALDAISSAFKQAMQDPAVLANEDKLGRTPEIMMPDVFTDWWTKYDANLKTIMDTLPKQ